jgi:hypothetical protein
VRHRTHSRQFAAGYECDRSSRTRSTRERRIINKLIKFFFSDLGSFQCPRHCASQYTHRPEDSENDYSESNQLRRIIGLRSVGVSIGDETPDTYRRGCCVFHGFNAPFMRSLKLTPFAPARCALKVTPLSPSAERHVIGQCVSKLITRAPFHSIYIGADLLGCGPEIGFYA